VAVSNTASLPDSVRYVLCAGIGAAGSCEVIIGVEVPSLPEDARARHLVEVCAGLGQELFLLGLVGEVLVEVLVDGLRIVALAEHLAELAECDRCGLSGAGAELLGVVDRHVCPLDSNILLLLLDLIVDSSANFLSRDEADEVLALLITDIFAVEFEHAPREKDDLVAILGDAGHRIILQIEYPQAIDCLQNWAHLLLEITHGVVFQVQLFQAFQIV